ncbi:MAG: DUF5050 domain-containing protein [Sedimentibacter sp.]|uniref:DUF5050 domain-containing protein n=1 Tax=Sedimentibacter sp. TaxID=1960295 RepID=UPI0031598C33
MKKFFTYFITILFIISSLSSTAYALEKDSESIDVRVFINDMRVPITKCINNYYIKIDTLKEFGFDVNKDRKQKIINVYQNPDIIMKPFETDDYITKCYYVANTEYKVFINNCAVDAKKSNNDILIDVNSFLNIKGYDFEKQANSKDNTCDININNSDGIRNLFTMADKTEVHVTKRENYFYRADDRVGVIQDNMEWISLDYIKKLIDFDKVIEEKDEESISICLEKGNYKVKIQVNVNGHAFAECGPFYFELTAMPLELNGELYLSFIDSVRLFNLEVIKDDDIINNKKIGPDYGNIVNGMNIVKNNDWFYYINIKDNNSLYRTNQDMSENNKIINGPVDQFYIENQTIYYIGYNYEANNGGIFKSDIDGTDKQQIAGGAASFLNILDSKLYYCEGSDGGNLCTIDKDGHNKKILIQGRIAYPNLVNGWIYYINLLDNSSIYKAEINGSYNIKINTKSAKCLNVDNDKIFFSDENYSYFMNHDGSFENKIYNMPADNILVSSENIYLLRRYHDVYKQDKDSILGDLVYEGSEVSGVGLQNDMLIISLQNEVTRSIQRYDIGTGINDAIDIQDAFSIEEVQYPYVYYKPDGGSKLLRYNVDTKSSEIIVPGIFSRVLNIVDDWIYYEENEGEGLYRVKTDGTNMMKLLDNDAYYSHIDSSGIYYLKLKSDLTIEGYYKVNLDGTDRKMLINDLDSESPFEVYKDYIYYNQEDGMYRVKKDGTDKKKIINQSIQEFKIIDDNIYYKSQGDLYSAACDGGEKEKIIEDSGLSFTKYKDNIFYLKYDKQYSVLFKYNLRSKQSEQVTSMKFPDTYIRFVKEKDNNLLLSCSAGIGFNAVTSYYLLDMDTDEVRPIQNIINNGYITNVFIEDGNLYYVKIEQGSKLIIK